MRKTLIGIFVGLIIAGGGSIAYAVGAAPVATGGTGWTAFTANTILLGNGTTRLATTTAGTNGQYLMLFNGVPRWVTATSSGSVTSVTGTWPITSSGGSTPNITWSGIATSSNPSAGTLAAWNSTNTLYGIATSSIFSGTAGQILAYLNGAWTGAATTTLTNTSPITTTFNAGTNQWTVACATCNTSSASVTSITGGTGLNGGTITSAGTLALKSYLSTSTAETAGQLAVWGTTSGTPASMYSVATSTETRSAAFSSTGTVGNNVGGTSGTLSSVIDPSFTWYATSTTFVGTTTVLLNIKTSIAATINNGTCEARNGLNGTFINVQLGYGTASTSMMVASSTVNTNTFTTNNTPSAGSRLAVDFGTTTAITVAGQLYVNCTFKITK